jgi:hypothetical protein
MALTGHRSAACAVALAALLLAPAAAPGQSRTLGSPLTQAPNAGFGCETKPTVTANIHTGRYDFLPSGQADCTWFQSGVFGSVDYSDPRTGSVPADGFITNVAVRSGPNPSALRIVIVRQIGGITGGNTHTTVCCGFRSETPPANAPPLRPAPNAITNFPVNIPVERNIRGTSAVADYVGISGVSGTGALPLFSNGRNNIITDYTLGNTDAGFFYPRMGALEGPGGGTRNNESIPGVEVLVQWTWTPPGAVPPPALPPVVPAGAGTPAAAAAARVAAGRALIGLVCGADAACRGTLELLSRGALGKKKVTLYGKKSYSIAAGEDETLKVKLNSRGKRLLRNKKRAKVALRLTPADGAPITAKLTLKG